MVAGVEALMAEVRGCSGPRATAAVSQLPLGLGPLSAGWSWGLLREMCTQILLVAWKDAAHGLGRWGPEACDLCGCGLGGMGVRPWV